MPVYARREQPLLEWPHGALIGGSHFRRAVTAVDTGGRFCMLKATMPAETFVWPHTHTHEDEITFVHRGRIGARVGERDVVVEEGGFLFKPRGIVHAMWNLHASASLLHEIITPAGFEELFEEMSRLDLEEPDASPDRRHEIATRYGLHVNTELIPELIEKHSLRA